MTYKSDYSTFLSLEVSWLSHQQCLLSDQPCPRPPPSSSHQTSWRADPPCWTLRTSSWQSRKPKVWAQWSLLKEGLFALPATALSSVLEHRLRESRVTRLQRGEWSLQYRPSWFPVTRAGAWGEGSPLHGLGPGAKGPLCEASGMEQRVPIVQTGAKGAQSTRNLPLGAMSPCLAATFTQSDAVGKIGPSPHPRRRLFGSGSIPSSRPRTLKLFMALKHAN